MKKVDKKKLFSNKRKTGPMFLPKEGKLIAVTGGIGSGKSYILECFKRLGFVIFNVDKEIHKLLDKDGSAVKEVGELFPNTLLDNAINRKLLGDIVFFDDEKMEQLQKILYPKLKEAQLKLIIETQNKTNKSIVFEVPLLFENNKAKFYDYVVVAVASRKVRRERVLKRPYMNEEKFKNIINKQVSDKIRIKGSDFVIKTDYGKINTFKQIKAIINDRSKTDCT